MLKNPLNFLKKLYRSLKSIRKILYFFQKILFPEVVHPRHPDCFFDKILKSFRQPLDSFFADKVRNLQKRMYIIQTKSRNFPLETENAVLTSVAKIFTKSPKAFASKSEKDKKNCFFFQEKISRMIRVDT